MKRDIAQYVSEVAALKNARIIDAVQPNGDLPSEFRNPGSQVFSFRTLMFALMYYRFDTSFHYLMYSGEGRLIDNKTGDTVWRSTCDYNRRRTTKLPAIFGRFYRWRWQALKGWTGSCHSSFNRTAQKASRLLVDIMSPKGWLSWVVGTQVTEPLSRGSLSRS